MPTTKQTAAPPRIATTAFSRQQFRDMLSESVGTDKLVRTTRQQVRLVYGLVTLVWGQRSQTWWTFKSHRSMFVEDRLVPCGYTGVKNFIPTKTDLIANPRVETRDFDREDTV